MSIQSCKRVMLIWKLISGLGVFADEEAINKSLPGVLHTWTCPSALKLRTECFTSHRPSTVPSTIVLNLTLNRRAC